MSAARDVPEPRWKSRLARTQTRGPSGQPLKHTPVVFRTRVAPRPRKKPPSAAIMSKSMRPSPRLTAGMASKTDPNQARIVILAVALPPVAPPAPTVPWTDIKREARKTATVITVRPVARIPIAIGPVTGITAPPAVASAMTPVSIMAVTAPTDLLNARSV